MTTYYFFCNLYEISEIININKTNDELLTGLVNTCCDNDYARKATRNWYSN